MKERALARALTIAVLILLLVGSVMVLLPAASQAADSTNVVWGTTVSASSYPNPSSFLRGFMGQTVTFTATVSAVPPGTGTPGGTVTFYDGTRKLCIGTLSAGKATGKISTLCLLPGDHQITAVYNGSTNYCGSSSPRLTQSSLLTERECIGVRSRTCQANLRTIESAVHMYYADNEEYPTSVDELVPVFLKYNPTCPTSGKTYVLVPSSEPGEPPTVSCPGNEPGHSI